MRSTTDTSINIATNAELFELAVRFGSQAQHPAMAHRSEDLAKRTRRLSDALAERAKSGDTEAADYLARLPRI